jgi:intein/homing endonuclease
MKMEKFKISKNELIRQVKDIAVKLKRRPQKRDDMILNYNARKYFGSWNNLMKSAGYKVRYYQKINSVKFDEDFAYFLGLLITDGHIHSNNITKRYKIAIYTSYNDEKKMIARLIKKLFNYNPGITSRMYGFNKRPNYEIRIASKNLVNILVSNYEIPSGAKSLIVCIPSIMFKSSKNIKKSFIRGVIDGDGSIMKNNVKIASGSKLFLEGLKILLESISISSGNVIKDNKITNTYSIRISNKEGYLKVEEMYNANYYYSRKKAKFNKI